MARRIQKAPPIPEVKIPPLGDAPQHVRAAVIEDFATFKSELFRHVPAALQVFFEMMYDKTTPPAIRRQLIMDLFSYTWGAPRTMAPPQEFEAVFKVLVEGGLPNAAPGAKPKALAAPEEPED